MSLLYFLNYYISPLSKKIKNYIIALWTRWRQPTQVDSIHNVFLYILTFKKSAQLWQLVLKKSSRAAHQIRSLHSFYVHKFKLPIFFESKSFLIRVDGRHRYQTVYIHFFVSSFNIPPPSFVVCVERFFKNGEYISPFIESTVRPHRRSIQLSLCFYERPTESH